MHHIRQDVLSLMFITPPRCYSTVEDPFVYSRAVVCGGVASSLSSTSLRLESSKLLVDIENARKQQKEYVEVSLVKTKGYHCIEAVALLGRQYVFKRIYRIAPNFRGLKLP